jgi:hypothetical protein
LGQASENVNGVTPKSALIPSESEQQIGKDASKMAELFRDSKIFENQCLKIKSCEIWHFRAKK